MRVKLVQFLFDIFAIYIGDQDCSELGMRLPEVVSTGDYLMFNAVKVRHYDIETHVVRRVK